MVRILQAHHKYFLWKGIVSVKEAFGANISHRVGNGENIYFWLDRWIGDKPLAERFPNLFSCARK